VLTRRRFIQASGAAGVIVTLPLGCQGPPQPRAVLSDDERRMMAALADAILPPDDTPGASELGAVDYVEQLLGALDPSGTLLFAGGPYSGRQPYGDGQGGASEIHPPNDFLRFVPLDRVTEAAWRLRLHGSAGVDGGGPNDDITGPTVGLVDRVKEILALALRFTPAPPETLDAGGRAALLGRLDQEAIDFLVDLVSEACFAAPEYGGNKGGAGWALCHYEGDSQPLGYSLYDIRLGAYRERAGHPVSTPSMSDPEPLDDDTREFATLIVELLGGEEFT
jgi:hypothetical protein